MASDDRDWVVAPDEARIDIAIGPGAKVSPEVRAALERLAEAMGTGDDVQGYALCSNKMICGNVQVTSCAFNISCSMVYLGS